MVEYRGIKLQFWLAPCLGIILALILFLNANEVIRHQSSVFKAVSEARIGQISSVSAIESAISLLNSDIAALLLTASERDESDIYTKAKEILTL